MLIPRLVAATLTVRCTLAFMHAPPGSWFRLWRARCSPLNDVQQLRSSTIHLTEHVHANLLRIGWWPGVRGTQGGPPWSCTDRMIILRVVPLGMAVALKRMALATVVLCALLGRAVGTVTCTGCSAGTDGTCKNEVSLYLVVNDRHAHDDLSQCQD
jgi:hypothetical protein